MTREHLTRASDRVTVDGIASLIEDLRPHQRLTLRAICQLANDGETPARVGAVFHAYSATCSTAEVDPNTERSLQNYLGRLVDVGLVDSEAVRTETGGRFNRYDLARSSEYVTRALRSVN